jgi:undecaprenyl diphosphate synthase
VTSPHPLRPSAGPRCRPMPDLDPNRLPVHVAVIMDGNGRWAKKRQLNRVKGHEAGARAVREIVEMSRELGIQWLTLYAFSEENWSRSNSEISALMRLLRRFIGDELPEMMRRGIRLQTIGRIEKLPEKTRNVLYEAIAQTKFNRHMVLTLALSYGGQQEITDAVRKIAEKVEKGELRSDHISAELITENLYTAGMPEPDLLIRTSGECRISNFLLWQIAYTEIYITKTLWPDFRKEDYASALLDFQKRERRFGKTSDR